MASAGLHIFGIFLATLGFVGDIIICALPMWKVSAFVGNNIVTAQIFWEGLWMNCVKQSTGQMQCKVYDSMLALPQDLQAARALVVISILVAFLGILLAVVGGKCTNCIEDELAKSRVAIAAEEGARRSPVHRLGISKPPDRRGSSPLLSVPAAEGRPLLCEIFCPTHSSQCRSLCLKCSDCTMKICTCNIMETGLNSNPGF
uniref:Claudin n=1 Tax=Fundulus heteroclitus TaxID=8078 RepID=A0A3Q2Q9G6_FUNHE